MPAGAPPPIISINPISWSRGDEAVSAEECPGSRTDDMAGALEMELLQAEYDVDKLMKALKKEAGNNRGYKS